MKSFLYVQAVVVATGETVGPETVTFRHVNVTATDEAEAYSAGYQSIGDISEYLRQAGFPHPNTWFMNDYVVEITHGM